MLKKFLKLIKKNEVEKKDIIVEDILISKEGLDEENKEKIENILEEENIILEESKENEIKHKEDLESDKNKIVNQEDLDVIEDVVESEKNIIVEEKYSEKIHEEIVNEESDLEYIKEGKIKREKSIKAINLYTKEEQIFKTHKECSRKLKVPLGYIKENLKYGYTDYLGDAITYLSNELQVKEVGDNQFSYIYGNKTPLELFNALNNKIFTAKISNSKREEILSSEKIEPVKMHYIFECIDEEYNDYFKKYKSIIKRGGKKKIELVDKKGEAIEIFKSIDECAGFLGKDRNEVVDMLKFGDTKVGRYEIRYSLRNI